MEKVLHDESLCQLQLLFTISDLLITLHSRTNDYLRSYEHVILL